MPALIIDEHGGARGGGVASTLLDPLPQGVVEIGRRGAGSCDAAESPTVIVTEGQGGSAVARARSPGRGRAVPIGVIRPAQRAGGIGTCGDPVQAVIAVVPG